MARNRVHDCDKLARQFGECPVCAAAISRAEDARDDRWAEDYPADMDWNWPIGMPY